ncbi:hypothetical protein LOTGIDRAFT_153204 [Lottia gigantea]|uniref:Uncharacterized protein n=1 Tax=Lottia gigantea TaxID=225164 RepID=V4AF08_LOTGI|nr:hypothetical protein LOTGIDRAFT_153204 [Lottia gigantea]ESO93745.1 hypothetical protein LOTGIDRAFT_153204 [Lottia gigantea]
MWFGVKDHHLESPLRTKDRRRASMLFVFQQFHAHKRKVCPTNSSVGCSINVNVDFEDIQSSKYLYVLKLGCSDHTKHTISKLSPMRALQSNNVRYQRVTNHLLPSYGGGTMADITMNNSDISMCNWPPSSFRALPSQISTSDINE